VAALPVLPSRAESRRDARIGGRLWTIGPPSGLARRKCFDRTASIDCAASRLSSLGWRLGSLVRVGMVSGSYGECSGWPSCRHVQVGVVRSQ